MKALEDHHAVPGEDVVLSCELSRAGASVRWLKDGKAVRQSQKYNVLREGARAMLVIRGASAQDSGTYTCEAEASRTSASLRVEGQCWQGWCPGGLRWGSQYPVNFPSVLLPQRRETDSRRSLLTCKQRSRAQLCSRVRQRGQPPG